MPLSCLYNFFAMFSLRSSLSVKIEVWGVSFHAWKWYCCFHPFLSSFIHGLLCKYCQLFDLEVWPLFWQKVKFFLKILTPSQVSLNFYIEILNLSEVLQGIAITNIPGYLNLKSRHSFGQRWSFFSRYCLQTRPQWIFTSKSWIWVRFCRVLPLQIFPAIWTWSLGNLLAISEVFSQCINSKPSLNEFLHPNLGFEWSSAGYCHYKYIRLFELEV